LKLEGEVSETAAHSGVSFFSFFFSHFSFDLPQSWMRWFSPSPGDSEHKSLERATSIRESVPSPFFFPYSWGLELGGHFSVKWYLPSRCFPQVPYLPSPPFPPSLAATFLFFFEQGPFLKVAFSRYVFFSLRTTRHRLRGSQLLPSMSSLMLGPLPLRPL